MAPDLGHSGTYFPNWPMESNYLFSGRLAGLDLYHREAAPGIPNHVPVAGTCGISAAVGKVKWNVAPRPLFAVAHKRPPCDSTMERLIDNPMPLPWGLVVKNESKIRSIFSLGNPMPVS